MSNVLSEVAREHQEPDRHQPRAEAAPAQAPAPTPRARPAARFRSTKAAKDVPPTAGHPVDLDVPPPNPKAPPAPAGGTRAYAPAPTREHHRR